MLVLEWRSYPEICDPQTMFSCIWNRIKIKTEIFLNPLLIIVLQLRVLGIGPLGSGLRCGTDRLGK